MLTCHHITLILNLVSRCGESRGRMIGSHDLIMWSIHVVTSLCADVYPSFGFFSVPIPKPSTHPIALRQLFAVGEERKELGNSDQLHQSFTADDGVYDVCKREVSTRASTNEGQGQGQGYETKIGQSNHDTAHITSRIQARDPARQIWMTKKSTQRYQSSMFSLP